MFDPVLLLCFASIALIMFAPSRQNLHEKSGKLLYRNLIIHIVLGLPEFCVAGEAMGVLTHTFISTLHKYRRRYLTSYPPLASS